MSPMAVGAVVLASPKSQFDHDSGLLDRARAALEGEIVPDGMEIQLIFVFPGRSVPDFVGLEVSRRRGNRIDVSIAVPAELADEQELVELGREAIQAGIARLTGTAKRTRRPTRVPISQDRRATFEVPVSLPMDRLSLEELQALEEEADRAIRRARLGSITGHEFGGGSFEIFVETRPRHEARVRDLIAGIYAEAIRRSGPGHEPGEL
jgi:hypothetical protein